MADADSQLQPRDGAEDGYFSARPLPAANRPLADIAELVLIRGFDENVRARLRPFVTALPRFTAVNVNTARPEVLAATIEGLDIDSARSLSAQRERAYFRECADFLDRLPGGIVAVEDNIVSAATASWLRCRSLRQ
jgi:general secretion pathway protein K